jgi:hypothetical protein
MFVYRGHGLSWLKRVTYSCPGQISVRSGFVFFPVISSRLKKAKVALEQVRKAQRYVERTLLGLTAVLIV